MMKLHQLEIISDIIYKKFNSIDCSSCRNIFNDETCAKCNRTEWQISERTSVLIGKEIVKELEK